MLFSEFYGNTKGCLNLSKDYSLYDFFTDMEKIYMGTRLSKQAIYKLSNIIYLLNAMWHKDVHDTMRYKVEIMKDINELQRIVLEEEDFQ